MPKGAYVRQPGQYPRRVVTPWYDRNKDKVRNKRLVRDFGIDLKEYNRMFAKQNGCCAICGVHQSALKWKLAVDHNHETEVVRGLLCLNCNSALGKLQDDPEVIRRAATYIETH